MSESGQGRPDSFANTLKVQRSAVGSGSGRHETSPPMSQLGRRRTILYGVEIGSSGWIADIPERPSKASPIIQSDGCANCCLGTRSRSGTVWISGKPLKRLLSMHHVLNALKAAAAN